MSATLTPVAAGDRIVVVDALRGFALMGIVLVHMVEQYVGGPVPQTVGAFTSHGPVDSVIEGLINVFIRGKFFTIFSLLFGLSFFIQLERAEQKGTSFGARFLWRLAILFAIGFVHNLFYRGDILTVYALLGVVLVPLNRLSDRALLWTAVLLLIVPRFLIFGAEQALGLTPPDVLDNQAAQQAYWEVLREGSLGELFAMNAGYGFWTKMYFQFHWVARGYQTLALFLLGLYVGRRGYFNDLEGHRPLLRRLVRWGGGLTLGFFLLTGLTFGLLQPAFGSPVFLAAMTFADLGNMAMTGLLIGAFGLWYLKPNLRRTLDQLVPYGRMALTNYFVQSLIGTFIFFNYGLGLLGEIGSSLTFLLAIVLFVTQVVFSRYWLQRFHYGPLEWLWRSLTYGRWQPLRKARAVAVVNH